MLTPRPEDLIEQAAAAAASQHPREQVAERKSGFSEMPFGNVVADGEPRPGSAPENPLNHMTTHPRAIACMAQLMDTAQENVRLSQSHVIARCKFTSNLSLLVIRGCFLTDCL